MSARAEECRNILAQFAHDFGLVREREGCVKRKRADVKEVQAYITKLHTIVKKLKTTTGVNDMDALERNLPSFLKESQATSMSTTTAATTIVTHPASVNPPIDQVMTPDQQLFKNTPETFSFMFPSHIALKYGDTFLGDEFVSSEGATLCVVGFMKHRPTFSVLAVRKIDLDTATKDAPVVKDAFKVYSTMFVLRQLERDDGTLNKANIRKFGPSVNVYNPDVEASFYMNTDGGEHVTVRVHNVAAKGKRRIKLIDVENKRRVWSVNEQFFSKLSRV